jgi:hypothetical protein
MIPNLADDEYVRGAPPAFFLTAEKDDFSYAAQ